jgi:hypothetical protein
MAYSAGKRGTPSKAPSWRQFLLMSPLPGMLGPMNQHAVLTEVETHHGDFWLVDVVPRIQFKTLRSARSAAKNAGCTGITEKSLKGVVLELRLTSASGWQPRIARASREPSPERLAGRAEWKRNLEICVEKCAAEVSRRKSLLEEMRARLVESEERYQAALERLAEAD